MKSKIANLKCQKKYIENQILKEIREDSYNKKQINNLAIQKIQKNKLKRFTSNKVKEIS